MRTRHRALIVKKLRKFRFGTVWLRRHQKINLSFSPGQRPVTNIVKNMACFSRNNCSVTHKFRKNNQFEKTDLLAHCYCRARRKFCTGRLSRAREDRNIIRDNAGCFLRVHTTTSRERINFTPHTKNLTKYMAKATFISTTRK